MLKHSLFVFICLVVLTSCSISSQQDSESQPISHSTWSKLLKNNVDENGLVNYQGFISDSLELNRYLNTLTSNHPNSSNWSTDETLAYWINAYNAFTIQLIIRNYPIKSIKDISGIIPRVNTAWDIEFIKIEEYEYDLNDIEHNIIRPNFDEARIHFALVCAAMSCPKLRCEAYVAEKLDSQLENQTYLFFNDSSKNQISEKEVKISKLLYWYESDFISNELSIVNYINQYLDIKIDENAEISYLDYDWRLNCQQ